MPTAPTAAPKPEPKAAKAKVELRVPASVALGDPIAIELVNVDDHDHAFLVPGKSNGCGVPPIEVMFVTKSATYRQDWANMGCGQGLVPPHWIVIPKGSSLKWDEATDVLVISGKSQPISNAKPLAPGHYTLKVTGADISASAPIVLAPAKKTP